jgi:electron transfer flavoprotein alpha subunit
MSKTLIIAFQPSEAETMRGFAQSFGEGFDVLLVTGGDCPAVGAGKVLTGGLPSTPPADSAASIASLCAGYSHIAAASTMRAKDILPRIAARLDAAMVSDIVSVDSESVFSRPTAAGAAIATVEVDAALTVLTVRPAGFGAGEERPNGPSEAVTISTDSKTERIKEAEAAGARPDLTQAKVVISGGRPLKDAETYEKLIGGLADILGGAAGATRAAVDLGIAANDLQVGQTGKVVAPDLYIAAGISGSTQHMAGIKDSKVIVAINTDGDAPIFESADFGLVMDLYEAIPQLAEKLKS